MEFVQRILGKVVGKEVGTEISHEETQAVAGGKIDVCTSEGGWNTWSGGAPYSGYWECDY